MALIEKNLSTLIFFRGWDWDVGVGIDFNSGDMSVEERSEKISFLYREHRVAIRNLASRQINNLSHSDQGVFVELHASYLLRDYISTGNIFFDMEDSRVLDAHHIYGGSARENIVSLCNEYLKETVSAETEWNCFLVELIPLGYEESYEAIPEQILEKGTAWIKTSIGEMHIKKSDFLALVGANKTMNTEIKSSSVGVSLEKSNAMTTAKNIADSLWRMEQHKEKRISEMANEVYAELYRLGFADQLPEKLENMTNWIRTVAPEHARKAGRPPKTITPNLK